MNKEKVWFVTGIDTNIGKTYATAYLAKGLAAENHSVITQKMIQTGCDKVSEDIEMHRKLLGMDFLEEDKNGLTCPYILSYPCSPHMAAERDNVDIDVDRITKATEQLAEKYEYVLLEGAGGLMVPITHDMLTIDYIKQQGYPVVLVTNGKLGSLNHTLLSIYACQQYGIEIKKIVYNLYPRYDEEIEQNTLEYLRCHFPNITLELMGEIG